MKKLFAFAATAMLTLNAFAQQNLDFKLEYKPSTVYSGTTTTNATITITFSGDGADDLVAAQGMENPTVQKVDNNQKMVMTTAKLNGSVIPFTIEVASEAGSEIAKVMPNGAKIYGKKTLGQTPVFDSISAKGAQKAIKDAIFETMKNTVTKTFIDAKKIKVGESFVQDAPITIPMGPMELEMGNKVTYTLKKIEAGKAYFDTTSILSASTEVQGQELKGSGTGKGTMVYDIASNYTVLQEDDVTMKMDMDMQGILMTIGTQTKTRVETVITPAK